MEPKITKEEDRLYKDNNALMRALFRTVDRCGYKRSWVYFEFTRQSYKPTLDEFISLGKWMKYKSGWADMKFKEYYSNFNTN